jgi:adenylate kinase family enzyme
MTGPFSISRTSRSPHQDALRDQVSLGKAGIAGNHHIENAVGVPVLGRNSSARRFGDSFGCRLYRFRIWETRMRIVVIGTSGAGKTTLARRIAARLNLPHIELDAINWQAGWRDLDRHDRDEFLRRVTAAIQAETWVLDGGYSSVRDTLFRRATHLVWLDYKRRVIMVRVIRRSLLRAILRTELWPGTGNREQWRHLLRPSHPIRWAWSTWSRRRQETAERLGRTEYRHLVVLRLRRPGEVRHAVELLALASPSNDELNATLPSPPLGLGHSTPSLPATLDIYGSPFITSNHLLEIPLEPRCRRRGMEHPGSRRSRAVTGRKSRCR